MQKTRFWERVYVNPEPFSLFGSIRAIATNMTIFFQVFSGNCEFLLLSAKFLSANLRIHYIDRGDRHIAVLNKSVKI
jgi:hypothetical protein